MLLVQSIAEKDRISAGLGGGTADPAAIRAAIAIPAAATVAASAATRILKLKRV